MPEQAEFVSDSGDYTWKPQYVRRSIDSLRLQDGYDTTNLGDKLTKLERRIAHLESIVHKYINQDGTL
jgi:hypothetical protein